ENVDGGPDERVDAAGSVDAAPPSGPLAFVPSFVASNTDAITLSGRCEPGPIEVGGFVEREIDCVDGAFEIALSAREDGRYELTVTQGELRASGTWLRDTEAPTVLQANAPSPTPVRSALVSVRAQDNDLPLQVCLTLEAASDACFVDGSPVEPAAPGAPVSFAALPVLLGLEPQEYVVSAYVRDRAGNESDEARVRIRFTPSDPPAVERVIAVRAGATPTIPAAFDALQVRRNEEVHVHFSASDALGLVDERTVLATTEDEESFVPAAASPCEPIAPSTHCRALRSPTDGYFRVRVRIENVSGQASTASSSPLNVPFRFLAGDTDSGLDGSAQGATFAERGGDNVIYSVRAASLLALDSGTLIFLDDARGLLAIDPSQALIDVLLPETGRSAGDGGPLASAEATSLEQLAYAGGDVFFVRDLDRVRRIDLGSDPPSIDTVLGGGERMDGERLMPLEVALPAGDFVSEMTLTASPNGDLYVAADTSPTAGGTWLHLDASEGVVNRIRFSGMWSGFDVSACEVHGLAFEFDAAGEALSAVGTVGTAASGSCSATAPGRADMAAFSPSGAFQSVLGTPDRNFSDYWDRALAFPVRGVDGTIVYNHQGGKLTRFNPDAGALELITRGTRGRCDDGTALIDCPMRTTGSAIGRDGTLYLVDNGQIRVRDSRGAIRTLFGRAAWGESGSSVLDARFGRLEHFWLEDGTLSIMDVGAARLFRLSPDVELLAGSGLPGSPSIGEDATSQHLFTEGFGTYWSQFGIINGEYHYADLRGINVLREGAWQRALGHGATPYPNVSDTIADDDVSFNGGSLTAYPASVLAKNDAGTVLVGVGAYSGNNGRNARLFEWRPDDGQLRYLTGDINSRGTFCVDGLAIDGCSTVRGLDVIGAAWSAADGAWYAGARDEGRIVAIERGATMRTVYDFGARLQALAYDGGTRFAACTNDGRLMLGSIGSPPSELPLGTDTVECGRGIHFDGTVLFSIEQNGVPAVAEYRVD
ncbi:MAG: hypothetical protein AAF411_20635, partial [Myxococcota bacterium]